MINETISDTVQRMHDLVLELKKYYDTDTTSDVRLYQPPFKICDGSLIKTIGDKEYVLGKVNNSANYDSIISIINGLHPKDDFKICRMTYDEKQCAVCPESWNSLLIKFFEREGAKEYIDELGKLICDRLNRYAESELKNQVMTKLRDILYKSDITISDLLSLLNRSDTHAITDNSLIKETEDYTGCCGQFYLKFVNVAPIRASKQLLTDQPEELFEYLNDYLNQHF